MRGARNICLLAILSVGNLVGCVSFVTPADRCPPDTQQLENCPPLTAITDTSIQSLYRTRAWIKPSKLNIDTIRLGKEAEINVKSATAKFIGPRRNDAVDSLAAKIWMIENAQHTIDVFYYIYKNDLSGKAIMGALCDAVERGVDIRFVVDGIGSIMLAKSDMRALESCQLDAGFMRNAQGDITVHKARIQAIIFNSITKLNTSPNRRAHDKLLVVDGSFSGQGTVMVGGRNISLAYYGLTEHGEWNPDTYADAELLIANGPDSETERLTVSNTAEIYFTLLFYFKGNKPITIASGGSIDARYSPKRRDFRDSLARLKSFPAFQRSFAEMPDYMDSGFHAANVRLAHEFGNLINKRVVRDAIENMELNPNSISRLMLENDGYDEKIIRLVSPYLFLAKYKDSEGNVVLDEGKRIHEWLAKDLNRRFEIVTNSLITSDNTGAQSVIDMDTAPRLLLTDELRERWLNDPKGTEYDAEFMSSAEWTEMVKHPRIAVYETGKIDSRLAGGDIDYGKMHAKFIVTDLYGFVGTSNFDYRSRLYNNELGFFFTGAELLADLNDDFDFLASHSYLWGSPEWLEMRRHLIEQGGKKGRAVRKQRRQYKILRSTGLKWLF